MNMCRVCGGIVFASNESSSYSGPICNNVAHAAGPLPAIPISIETLKKAVDMAQETMKEWSDLELARKEIASLEAKLKDAKESFEVIVLGLWGDLAPAKICDEIRMEASRALKRLGEK